MISNYHWHNKKVLITGHTGFKGGWLSLWLHDLGARIHGIALAPSSQPNFFDAVNLKSLLTSDDRIDIRDADKLQQAIHAIKPDIVFHLAAQPLVQYGYEAPVETFAVNALGTAHVLEAIRTCDAVQAAIMVTTDKCYDNLETQHAYHEHDRLGGKDPYSSSKACAELITHAYRSSYFQDHRTRIATARAGNVIGGGDWSAHRLIPDCIRAYAANTPITLRYPQATRPWQHVLESLSGYILLAEHLMREEGDQFAEAWNFGPEKNDMQTVGVVTQQVCELLNIPMQVQQVVQYHEANLLQLDSTKAKQRINWHPRWHLTAAITKTVNWYQHYLAGEDMLTLSRAQIQDYLSKIHNVALTPENV